MESLVLNQRLLPSGTLPGGDQAMVFESKAPAVDFRLFEMLVQCQSLHISPPKIWFVSPADSISDMSPRICSCLPTSPSEGQNG